MKYHIPRMISNEEIMDFKIHCVHCAGDFVQSQEENAIKNSNLPKALDFIFLYPSVGQKEGHDLLHSQSRKIINRKKITLDLTKEWLGKKARSIAKN